MTAKDRIIIQHAKRIIKLEKDIALANARIAALEARPVYIQVVPLEHPYVAPLPATTWPNYPLIGDFPLSPNTCSGVNATVSGASPSAIEVRQ